MCGTHQADVAQRAHMVEAREATWTTWMHTWRIDSVGLRVCGPMAIVGPRKA